MTSKTSKFSIKTGSHPTGARLTSHASPRSRLQSMSPGIRSGHPLHQPTVPPCSSRSGLIFDVQEGAQFSPRPSSPKHTDPQIHYVAQGVRASKLGLSDHSLHPKPDESPSRHTPIPLEHPTSSPLSKSWDWILFNIQTPAAGKRTPYISEG